MNDTEVEKEIKVVKRTIPTSFFDVDLIEIAEVFVARITSDYDRRSSLCAGSFHLFTSNPHYTIKIFLLPRISLKSGYRSKA